MRLTIKAKFLLGLLVIFTVSLLLLNHFIVRIIDSSNEKIITQDLVELKLNSSVYVRQTFMINHFDSDDIYFRQIAGDMVQELHAVTSSSVGAYSVGGALLNASDKSAFAGAEDSDLKLAVAGKTAYTVFESGSDAKVYYSYPVVVDGRKVGILRFAKDFMLLHEQSRQIVRFVYAVTIIIFAAAFLFSYLLSGNVTAPIVKLTKASTAVRNGDLSVRLKLKRKDELGSLADNFNRMIERLGTQIERIKRDRDRLDELNTHRKRFFDNVTHELKTPLTSILGYAGIIRENGFSDKAFFDKGMNHIVSESERLHALVLRLLEASMETSTPDAMEPVDAGRLLQDVCEAMAFKAERYGKTIRSGIGPALWVRGSENRLRQLFINLIDNAIKYGSPSSVIFVNAVSAEGEARVEIANSGDEIDPELLPKLFEPFYRADRSELEERGSRGLGLSICKTIVDEHAGSIRIVSENKRTSAEIGLPAAGPPEELG
ncbi:sensor histidine kinase [Paenibacillus humicola]|uniref:sensor histidine kinase n=1 Tax=Paenibacillus humicola TaxID=3110540 RepID=UPI00237C1B5D|nr:HAMP domain-containing sensor histidine kinase [Paenibacillus humicola]